MKQSNHTVISKLNDYNLTDMFFFVLDIFTIACNLENWTCRIIFHIITVRFDQAIWELNLKLPKKLYIVIWRLIAKRRRVQY